MLFGQATQIYWLVCWSVSQPGQIGWYVDWSVNPDRQIGMLVSRSTGISLLSLDGYVVMLIGQSTRTDSYVDQSVSLDR